MAARRGRRYTVLEVLDELSGDSDSDVALDSSDNSISESDDDSSARACPTIAGQ